MNKFTSVNDVANVKELVIEGLAGKNEPFPKGIGENKTLGLVFFNPSLRTLLSSQKAAKNLGMDVIVMTIGKDGWNLEFEDGAVMNGDTQEHIKDAIRVISGYVDILGVRSFASLNDREKDYKDEILGLFERYSSVPIISLESAVRHPLQSLADLITISEQNIIKPKIAVSWAPHPKALPQAVTNSFLEWVKHIDSEVILTHPKGYELAREFTDGIRITNNQSEAFEGADFIYCKSWSSYADYGQCPKVAEDWTINEEKMALTNAGHFMHCLPIRRNVVATDAVIDNSLVYKQAKNREYAAQVVLKKYYKGTMIKLTVVKIGGQVLDDDAKLSQFLIDFSKIEGNKVLVHGGGKLATSIADKLNIKTEMIEGRRITNAENLKVVTMVYAGLINKNLVAKLQSLGCISLGLTGADLNIIPAHKRDHTSIDFGFVGDFNVEDIDIQILMPMIENNVTPIFCALTHDNKGSLLNTNADTISSGLALAFSRKYEVELIYCFEKPGVLLDADNDDTLIPKLSERDFERMKRDGQVHDGMIPKLDNAFDALRNGVSKVCIKDAKNLSNNIGTILEA